MPKNDELLNLVDEKISSIAENKKTRAKTDNPCKTTTFYKFDKKTGMENEDYKTICAIESTGIKFSVIVPALLRAFAEKKGIVA